MFLGSNVLEHCTPFRVVYGGVISVFFGQVAVRGGSKERVFFTMEVKMEETTVVV